MKRENARDCRRDNRRRQVQFFRKAAIPECRNAVGFIRLPPLGQMHSATPRDMTGRPTEIAVLSGNSGDGERKCLRMCRESVISRHGELEGSQKSVRGVDRKRGTSDIQYGIGNT